MNGPFVWEIRKSVRPRTAIILAVLFVVALILSAVSFDLIVKAMSREWMSGGALSSVYTEDVLESNAAAHKARADMREESRKKDKSDYVEWFRERSLQKEYEFALDGYVGKKIRISGEAFSGPMPPISATAESFLDFYMAFAEGILLFCGIFYGGRLYCSEYDSGTIKAVMTRPVSKNRITAVKLGSMCAVLSVAYFAAALLGFAYGAIMYGSVGSSTVIYSFNAMTANAATEGAAAFGYLMEGLLRVLFLSVTSFSLSTVARKFAAGMVPALIITLDMGSLLDGWGLTAFTVSNSLNFMQFFGASETVVRNGNFFVSLAVLAVCVAALLAALFAVTDRRDVN